jgi:hypothetical protein
MFIGLRGQKYQVHGLHDPVYSIISDVGIWMNARFMFLTSGRCPTFATHRAGRTQALT